MAKKRYYAAPEKMKYPSKKKSYMAQERREIESKRNMPRFGDEYYATMDSRRRKESEDAMMLHEDRNAIANMPQDVKMTPYPNPNYYGTPYLDDTARGIDYQIDDDGHDMKKNRFPKKY
jgi:hypothetical protein